MSWARVHRWLAIVLVMLLVVWSVTGLLFHLKPGWDRAYDMLTVERRNALPVGLAPMPAAVVKLEVFDTAIGPLYRVRTAGGGDLLDAKTGTSRAPLTADDARVLVEDAVSRSKHPYGRLVESSITDETARFEFENAVVEIGRRDARISQRGGDTDRIDWLYRMHYLQWTGNRTIDRAFSVLGLLLIWAVMIPGVVLFVRRFRDRRH